MAGKTKKKTNWIAGLLWVAVSCFALGLLAYFRAPSINNQAKRLQSDGVVTTGYVLDRIVTYYKTSEHVNWKVRYKTDDGKTFIRTLNDCGQGPDKATGQDTTVIYSRSDPGQARVGDSVSNCLKIAGGYRQLAFVIIPISLVCGIAAAILALMKKRSSTAKTAPPSTPQTPFAQT